MDVPLTGIIPALSMKKEIFQNGFSFCKSLNDGLDVQHFNHLIAYKSVRGTECVRYDWLVMVRLYKILDPQGGFS